MTNFQSRNGYTTLSVYSHSMTPSYLKKKDTYFFYIYFYAFSQSELSVLPFFYLFVFIRIHTFLCIYLSFIFIFINYIYVRNSCVNLTMELLFFLFFFSSVTETPYLRVSVYGTTL